jgi:hypothetical protein
VAASADCPHDEFVYGAFIRAVDEPGYEQFIYVASSVRCSACGLAFHWRGVNSGPPNANEATVTADGYELRCPIAPGPGAVVGLLEHVGLADRLVTRP